MKVHELYVGASLSGVYGRRQSVSTMTERLQTDDDGRLDPMVPEMPTRRVQTDGGRAHSTSIAPKLVLAEADAPLVPDLS